MNRVSLHGAFILLAFLLLLPEIAYSQSPPPFNLLPAGNTVFRQGEKGVLEVDPAKLVLLAPEKGQFKKGDIFVIEAYADYNDDFVLDMIYDPEYRGYVLFGGDGSNWKTARVFLLPDSTTKTGAQIGIVRVDGDEFVETDQYYVEPAQPANGPAVDYQIDHRAAYTLTRLVRLKERTPEFSPLWSAAVKINSVPVSKASDKGSGKSNKQRG